MSHRNTRLHLIVLTVLVAFLLPTLALAADKAPIDMDLDKYWGDKRDVKVIQKRLFRKEGRWEFTINGGIIPNDDFYIYGPLGARIAYFIGEDVSIELNGAYAISGKSELEDFLENENLLTVDLPQELEWYAGVNGLWSMLHGKFSAFATKLAHFDWFLTFGAGVIGTKLYNNEDFKERAYDIQGNLGTGFRFFILDWLALRVEYRHYLYQSSKGGVSYPAELSLGVSFFTSAPK